VVSWGNGEHVVVVVVAFGYTDISAVACDYHFRDEEVKTVERCGVGLRAVIDGWIECVRYVGGDGRVCSRKVDFYVCFQSRGVCCCWIGEYQTFVRLVGRDD
jgi:hypothetical protein